MKQFYNTFIPLLVSLKWVLAKLTTFKQAISKSFFQLSASLKAILEWVTTTVITIWKLIIVTLIVIWEWIITMLKTIRKWIIDMLKALEKTNPKLYNYLKVIWERVLAELQPMRKWLRFQLYLVEKFMSKLSGRLLTLKQTIWEWAMSKLDIAKKAISESPDKLRMIRQTVWEWVLSKLAIAKKTIFELPSKLRIIKKTIWGWFLSKLKVLKETIPELPLTKAILDWAVSKWVLARFLVFKEAFSKWVIPKLFILKEIILKLSISKFDFNFWPALTFLIVLQNFGIYIVTEESILLFCFTAWVIITWKYISPEVNHSLEERSQKIYLDFQQVSTNNTDTWKNYRQGHYLKTLHSKVLDRLIPYLTNLIRTTFLLESKSKISKSTAPYLHRLRLVKDLEAELMKVPCTAVCERIESMAAIRAFYANQLQIKSFQSEYKLDMLERIRKL
uniref:Ymf39 n=1 Tax=Bangia atropurpurea TaxID=31347 RepID=UPI001FCD6CC0|nr:Ymf39 [Bangia atropurpurea]UNJ18843.1 Ymf39 [Bangia atropurpurea]